MTDVVVVRPVQARLIAVERADGTLILARIVANVVDGPASIRRYRSAG